MDMFRITDEVREILLTHEGIKAAVGQKVFPVIAPEGTEGDFIVYQRDGFRQEYAKTGVAARVPLVDVAVVSESYDRARDTASMAYEALSGTWTDPFMEIRLEDSTEDFTDGKYVQVLQFSIKH